MPAYGTDLAYIHDTGFGEFVLQSAPGLLKLLRQNGVDQGLVVDLGCGSGIWARQLGFAGYDVIGVDASIAMVRLARAKAPKAKFIKASMVDVTIPPCDAVTSIGECISYAFAADKSGRALERFFRRVHRSLRPGGVFIFDLAGNGTLNGHWTGDDWVVLVDKSIDAEHSLLTRRITTFRRLGRTWRRSDEEHIVRLFQADAVRDALTRAGFITKRLRGYGEYPFRAGHFAILACKPRRGG